jgi:hypothetical protein
MHQPFEMFLSELAKVLEFSSLHPDEHGACLIIMKEGNVPLLFEFDDQLVPNTVLLSSPILSIPTTHGLTIHEALLKGNGGIEETLSVKPDDEMLYLHRRFHPQIGASEIDQLLQIFLQTLKEWKAKVQNIVHQLPDAHRAFPHPAAMQLFPYKA